MSGNPKVTILYEVLTPENISLEVFNIQGKRISILDKQYKTAGIYNIEWDASSFSSGIYILRLKSDINPLTTSKITLMK